MSVLDRFPHSTAELKRVKTVQFGVLSPDEIVSFVYFLFPQIASCACVCDRGRQNFSFFSLFLPFLFSFFDAKKLERREKERERERENAVRTNKPVGWFRSLRIGDANRAFAFSLSLHLNSPHPLSLFFSNY
jgi:hypothetical protein